MDWRLGDLVAFLHEGEQRIGVVVGNASSPIGMLYEVSFEDVIAKGVLAEELVAIDPPAVRACINLMAQGEGFSSSEPPTRQVMRGLALRASYVQELSAALERVEAAGTTGDESVIARFDVGNRVALQEGDSWLLAMVMGVRAVSGSCEYTLETMGEIKRVSQDELVPIGEVPCGTAALALGSRARFVASGHEDDDDFLGTICAVEMGGTTIYALAFDDEDILEGLTDEDLLPV